MGVMNDFEGQMSLNVTPDKQTPDMVGRGVLSQDILSSIRSRRSAISSVDSGSDMNPDVANIINDTLTRAVTVMNTTANIGSLATPCYQASKACGANLQPQVTSICRGFEAGQ